MILERLVLQNFRCFGPAGQTVHVDSGITALVGMNGSGKTAFMQALMRLFGVTADQRRLRRQDFHVPAHEEPPASQRSLVIEVVLAFPELDADGDDASPIPVFFQQMATDDSGTPKCRLRLEATWTDDGSVDGTIEERLVAVRTLDDFDEDDCVAVKAFERSRIQMIYLPAARDGSSQVNAFLRGRLWRAISWSDNLAQTLAEAGQGLNEAFTGEPAVAAIAQAVAMRWQEVHSAATDAEPVFRPVDLRLQEFVRKVEVIFTPDESGGERNLDELSEGQRSLFHLAMTAATLDIEGRIAAAPETKGFQPGGIPLPVLTLIAVEEPENSLAPFFLSRIVQQLKDLGGHGRAQSVISSHSASVLARVDPAQVRHFRLDTEQRTALVREIRLPAGEEQAAKFVREAVRTYPELYFARMAVLGEGASEEVVLPRLAEAHGLAIDRSFVAIVPIGGRHTRHLWRLLSDLEIPHVTLLDLDLGRAGGGWNRVAIACRELIANGTAPSALLGRDLDAEGVAAELSALGGRSPQESDDLDAWTKKLREFDVFFSAPLDLDYAMLQAFPEAYKALPAGMQGPSDRGEPRTAVLGAEGQEDLYGDDHDDNMRWYRYLFLGRSKPSTHMRGLSALTTQQIRERTPAALRSLIDRVTSEIEGAEPAEG